MIMTVNNVKFEPKQLSRKKYSFVDDFAQTFYLSPRQYYFDYCFKNLLAEIKAISVKLEQNRIRTKLMLPGTN